MIRLKNFITKIFLIVLVVLLLTVLAFFLVQKKSKELDVSRVALIDKISGNYVFRGNNPFITKDGEKVFAYNELTAHFNKILQEKGHQPLQEYYLIDVSLLDLDEYSEIKKEQNFFAQHPENGRLIHLSTLSPRLLLDSNIFTKSIIKNYNSWITNNITELHNIASSKKDKPIIIYIHCDSGRDRTGLMASSYELLFTKMNLAETKLQNIKDAGRDSDAFYSKATTSYCLHIQQENLRTPAPSCVAN